MSDSDTLQRRRGRGIPDDEPELLGRDRLDPRQVPLSQLRPAGWNPRIIQSERFKNLVASLQMDPEFLRLRPILAQGDGTIYAGNMRFRAAQQLGFQAVWAVVDDVDDKTAKERAIRDNNEWGEWQDDQLTEMLTELEQMGSDISLLGFDQKAMDALLKDGSTLPEPGDQDSDEAPKMWGVIVTCSDEAQQVELLERLTLEGRQVRALMS